MAEHEGPDRSDPAYWEALLGGKTAAAWLIDDLEVSNAIHSGRPRAIYKALKSRLATAPIGQDRDALAAVLANRRLFAEPIKRGPSMYTLNGIGTGCSGASERDPEDGTYITTLFFTFFFVPVLPLCQYLVLGAEGGGWYFLARVRPSRLVLWWRRLVLGGGAAAVLLGAFSIWEGQTHDDVHLLNGLDFPVTIFVGDGAVTVAPGQRRTRQLAEGRHRIVARRADGTVLEELDVDVPGGTDMVVYNVLGAAPLYVERVAYTADGVDPARGEKHATFSSMAGASWTVRDDIDFVFRTAPESVSMREHESVTTRTHVAVGDGGWRTAVAQLDGLGKTAVAAALARRVALLIPADEAALEGAYDYSHASGNMAATRTFVEAAVAAVPQSVQAHRLYQHHFLQTGARDEILPRYRTAYEKNPDSARDAYLYARIAPFDVALPIYETGVQKHPDDPWLRRGIAWIYFQTTRFADSVPHYRALLELRPDEAGAVVTYLARALAGMDRHDEALAAVGAVLDAAPARTARGEDGLAGGELGPLMRIYTGLRRLAPGARFPSVDERVRALLDEEPDAHVLARLAASVRNAKRLDELRPRLESDAVLDCCTLAVLSRTDVEAAARRALESSDETLAQLDDTARVSIACELFRTGHADKANALLANPALPRDLRAESIAALPDVSGLSEDLDIELRAAMLYAASRRTDDELGRTRLLAEARRLDTLEVVVPD